MRRTMQELIMRARRRQNFSRAICIRKTGPNDRAKLISARAGVRTGWQRSAPGGSESSPLVVSVDLLDGRLYAGFGESCVLRLPWGVEMLGNVFRDREVMREMGISGEARER